VELLQPEGGYRYNSDSLLLYYFVSLLKPKGTLLDVGCGCGVVGLLLKRDCPISLYGLDLQEEMIACAKENADHNALEGSFMQGSILEHESEMRYDWIVSNPPFYPSFGTLSDNPSKEMARYAKFMPLEEMIRRTNRLIHPKSSLVLCYDAAAFQTLSAALKAHKWHIHTLQFAYPTPQKNAQLVLIAAKKYQQGHPRILPPIFRNDHDFATMLTKQADTRSLV